jgi:hypothetical protein
MAGMLCDTAWVAGLQASNARQLVVEQGCILKTNIGDHIAKVSRRYARLMRVTKYCH